MKTKLLMIPVISSLLLGACTIPFVSQTVEKVTQTAEQKAAEQELLKNCTYDKEICQYMVAQMRAYESGFTMNSTTAIRGKTDIEDESITKMDGKGNMSTVSMKDGKETSAMVVFNNATYFKDYGEDTWMKMSSQDTNSEDNLLDIPNTIEEIQQSFEEETLTTVYNKLGQEPCGSMAPGLTCDIYEMYEQDSDDFKTKLWIDTKEHLSRKMESNFTGNGTNTIVFTYGPVTITEPSPVREFELPSYNMGSGPQMPSQEEIQKMMQDLPVEYPTE
jgi:hypothetical protein